MSNNLTQMELICLMSGEKIELLQKLSDGGEGGVYQTNQAGVLAKIYHEIYQERTKKLQIMAGSIPSIFVVEESHIPIAWPQELLVDNDNNCLGFLMPEIKSSQILFNLYHPHRRRENYPEFTWLNLHITALHVAFVLYELHSQNYVVGDLKPENLLVNKYGLVSIIDTDSFQISDPHTGKTYLSTVASPEHTAPEMFGENLKNTARSELQDRFSLATIIWLLLLGYHPFKPFKEEEGIYTSSNIDENIHRGLWMYGADMQVESEEASFPPLKILHPELQKCFRQCFNSGYKVPFARPSAADWVKALLKATDSLVGCSDIRSHYYVLEQGRCYWCETQQLLKYDVFAPQNLNLAMRIGNCGGNQLSLESLLQKARLFLDKVRGTFEFFELEADLKLEKYGLEKELGNERILKSFLQKKKENLEDEVEDLQNRLDETQHRRETLQVNLSQKERDNSDLKNQIEELQNRLDETRLDRETLQVNLIERDKENSSFKVQVKNLQQQLDELQIQKQRGGWKCLRWGLSAILLTGIGVATYWSYQERQNLYSQVSILQKNLDENQEQLQTRESKLDESQNRLQVVESELEETKSELDKSQTQLKTVETELRTKKAELDNYAPYVLDITKKLNWSGSVSSNSQVYRTTTFLVNESGNFDIELTDLTADANWKLYRLTADSSSSPTELVSSSGKSETESDIVSDLKLEKGMYYIKVFLSDSENSTSFHLEISKQ